MKRDNYKINTIESSPFLKQTSLAELFFGIEGEIIDHVYA